MKKLHALVIKAFIGPFIATFFITLFVLLMQFIWKYLDDLIGKGLDPLTVGELMVYASASLVPLALPLAVLLSSTMTFGALAEHYELVALKSSGNSLLRVMAPLVLLVGIISVGAFYFSNNVIPVANLKRSTLLFSIRKAKPSLNIREGEFYTGLDGYNIKVASKENDGKLLKDIIIYDRSNGSGPKKVIRAKEGEMYSSEDNKFLILKLFEGNSYENLTKSKAEGKRKFPFVRTSFKEEEIRFDLSSFQLERAQEDMFKDHFRMLTISQLESSIDSLEKKSSKRKEEYVEQATERLKFAIDSSISEKIAYQTEVTDSASHYILDKFPTRKHKGILDAAANLIRNNASFLRTIEREFKSRDERVAVHEIEWHRKFTLSVACLVFFFIGAPLGAIIRKGGLGMPFIFSTVIFIIFHVISMTTEKMAKLGAMDTTLGMWFATLIIVPIGAFLTYQTYRDAKLMNMETYANGIKKLIKVFKKSK